MDEVIEFLQHGFETPGSEGPGTPRASSGAKARGVSKAALSVLRTSTKIQQRRSGSFSHARFVEEAEQDLDLDGPSLDDPRRRAIASSASLTRASGRQRVTGAAATVEAQRRSTQRGDWSSAEEAVLAHKHMELGNKWTTISHFLPARSDNDVKNIWHSTLRSKNSDKRSFLRTYARAVRDCANDAGARRQAYDAAQRLCGPSQPIEVALATVQQEFQQLMLAQGNQPDDDELLENGRSPDHPQGQEADAELGMLPADAPELPSLMPLQQLQELPMESKRSGASSRTNSTAQDSQQHSGSGIKGHGSASPKSPVPRKSMRTTSGYIPSPAPNLLEPTDSGAVAGAGQTFHALLALPGDGHPGSRSRSQSHQHAHVLVADDGSLAPSSRASDLDSSCIARFSGLQLADQQQRQQQHLHLQQQQHQQHQQQRMSHQRPRLGHPHADLLPAATRHSASFSSGPQGRGQLPSHAMLSIAYGSVGTGSATAPGGTCSTAEMAPFGAAPVPTGLSPQAGQSGDGLGCAADMDDLVALGLDLTPEELRLLAQGDAAVPLGSSRGGGLGGLAEPAQGDGPVATAERALGLTRTLQQQQQHQFVLHVGAGTGGTTSSQLQAPGHRQQQSGYSSLELPASPRLEQQQQDPLEALLSELEHSAPPNQLPNQPPLHAQAQAQGQAQAQHHVSGGYPHVLPSLGQAGADRGGLLGLRGPRPGQPGAASPSLAMDPLAPSGMQQLPRQPGLPGLGPFVGGSGSFSHGGVMQPHLGQGSPHLYPPAGNVNAQGARPWLPGFMRAGAANANHRPLSSPAPFSCGTMHLQQQHQQQPRLLGGGSSCGGAGSTMPGFGQSPLAGGGGAGSGAGYGPVRLGSVVAQHMASLAEPSAVDVVTMGLDSGNLIESMDCEGQPTEPGAAGGAERRSPVLPDPFELTLSAGTLPSSQPQSQLNVFALGGPGAGAGLGQQQEPPLSWPASMPPVGNSRIGPMLQI